jgi:hypothetical protein
VADQPGASDDESTEEPGEPSPLGAAKPITIGRDSRSDGGNSGGGPTGGDRPKRGLAKLGVWGAVIVVALVVLLAFVPMFAAGLKKTPRNRVGISYGGGPIEGVHFQKIVQPGSGLFFNGLMDSLYLYPSDQVSYIVSKQVGVGAQKGSDSISAPTKDRVLVVYQLAVYFKLNIDKLREFHEQLGLRYQAYLTPGWNRLINSTFRQQLESALQVETRKVDVGDLFGNADRLVKVQNAVQTKLTQQLLAATGDNFFCAPTYQPGGPCGTPTLVIKKVDVPKSVAQAFQDNRTSEIQILTKQNQIAQREAEATAIRALGLTGEEYVKLKAVEAGKTNFWILPGGANVTIPSNPGGTGSTGSTTTTKPNGG